MFTRALQIKISRSATVNESTLLQATVSFNRGKLKAQAAPFLDSTNTTMVLLPIGKYLQKSSTTGHRLFAECPKHLAKHQIYSAKTLPSVALGIPHTATVDSAKQAFAECIFSDTRQSFAVCHNALGKIKQRHQWSGHQRRLHRSALSSNQRM